MPNVASLEAIATATLIAAVDDGRTTGDNFRLPDFLRPVLDASLADLVAKDNATALTESSRAGSSRQRRDALDALETLVHDGYNFIKAIPSYEITDARRLALFTAYGWAGGRIGDFNDSRVIGLARIAALPKPANIPAAQRYPASLLTKLAAELAITGETEETATGGARVEATRARNEALDVVENTISRVRFHYCCASEQTDRTPELLTIGLNPRSEPKAAPKPAGAAA